MDFVRLNDILANEYNLAPLPLKILQPTRDPYDALFVQPDGTLNAVNGRVSHYNQDTVHDLYKSIIAQAHHESVDLLVTPEYSLPWSIAEDISTSQTQPKEGALWVLGAESITPNQLEEFKASQAQKGITVHCETLSQQNKTYLCPLLYFFWARSGPEAESQLCIFIQFKSVPCGGTFETGNLYLGNTVYLFGDGQNEINFFSLICADVFNFNEGLVQNFHRDALILHVQLNEKPWHNDFSRYRGFLFSVGSNSNVELICLNWATGVRWNTDGDRLNDKVWLHSPNTAFYLPKIRFNKIPDSEIDILHKKGLYYNLVHKAWDSLFLNKNAQAILVQKYPLRFDGDQSLTVYPKLTIKKRFSPENGEYRHELINGNNDGFLELLSEFKPDDGSPQEDYNSLKINLREAHEQSPLAVERCLELLQGPPGKPKSWHNRYELSALHVAIEESPNRVTTHQESSTDRAGVDFRKKRIQTSLDASSLHTRPLSWPKPLTDISGGFSYKWVKELPHNNVISNDVNGEPATLILLNSSITKDAEIQYLKLYKGLASHALETSKPDKIVENIVKAKDRLCVVYKDNLSYRILHKSDGKKSIAIPANQSPTSIDSEDDSEY